MTNESRTRRPWSIGLVLALVSACGGASAETKRDAGGSGPDRAAGQSVGHAGQDGQGHGEAGGGPVDESPVDESIDGADTDGPADAAAPDALTTDADAATAGTIPTFVAVGYGGVRVRSLDLGKTWIDSQRLGGGGDDNYLLRTVAFGQGLFVALGWQLHTSPDGKSWTMRMKDAGQWMGGARFGDGRFVAAGGYGESTYSTDGLTWPQGGARLTDAARSVAFGNHLWVARADSNHWWQTSDGTSWMDLGGAHTDDVVFCGNQFVDAMTCTSPVGRDGGRVAFGADVWVGIRDGKIERSEDGGSTWKMVYTASDALEDVAFGDVAPGP
jgi:hypothetical protein